MARAYILPMPMAEEAWGVAEKEIVRALDKTHSLIEIGELKEGVLDGTKDLWCVLNDEGKTKAWAVGGVFSHAYLIWALGGEDAQDWLSTQEEFEAKAKAKGCTEVQFYGRLPWQRILRDRGYKPVQVVMRREL